MRRGEKYLISHLDGSRLRSRLAGSVLRLERGSQGVAMLQKAARMSDNTQPLCEEGATSAFSTAVTRSPEFWWGLAWLRLHCFGQGGDLRTRSPQRSVLRSPSIPTCKEVIALPGPLVQRWPPPKPWLTSPSQARMSSLLFRGKTNKRVPLFLRLLLPQHMEGNVTVVLLHEVIS